MNIKPLKFLGTLTTMALLSTSATRADDKNLVVRMAKLEIDSAQIETYKAQLKQEIEVSLRIEPGVLSLSAVSEKNRPTHITILEIYANQNSYENHLASAHFKKYKLATKAMIKSLELVETVPVALGTK